MCEEDRCNHKGEGLLGGLFGCDNDMIIIIIIFILFFCCGRDR